MYIDYRSIDNLGVTDSQRELITRIAETLPHGSGINMDWTVTMPKHGNNVRFHCAYHYMDEHGFYDGWIDFSIVLPVHCLGDNTAMAREFELNFHGANYRKLARYGLRMYLEDTIAWALRSMSD